MTREEFVEDAKVGEYIKIRTETEEFFKGVILDIGSSGVKIRISEENSEKRIAYSRILEYDVLSKPAEQQSAEQQVEQKPAEQKPIEQQSAEQSAAQQSTGQPHSAGQQENRENLHSAKPQQKPVQQENRKNKFSKDNRKPGAKQNDQRQVFKGFIHFYSLDRKSGTIKGASGGKISFRIYQVKDEELQKILLAGKNRKTRVTYTRGLNYYGKEAADRIAIDWDYYSDKEIKPYIGEELQVELCTYRKLKPILERKFTSTSERERKAVELMLRSAGENPFLNLPEDTSGNQYFQEAHRYMSGFRDENGEIIGIDLDEAEELFIKAIQSEDQINSSVANLVNIYVKKGDEKNLIKGIQLLEVYGKIFTEDKLTNLRIQLIDKSGNLEALELILLSAIDNCVMKNTLWGYEVKLAAIYCNQKKWEQAIHWLEKSRTILDENEREFQRYDSIRFYNIKQLAIAKYNTDDKEEAKKMVRELLEKMPEDPELLSIVNGTYNSDTTENGIEKMDVFNLQFEEVLLSEEGEISKYLIAKLKEVDLAKVFFNVPDVTSHLQEGRFVGNSADLIRILDYIAQNILRNESDSAQYRSAVYLGIAKLIYDFRNGTDKENDTRVSFYELKKYLGRYARYSADDLVERMAQADSIRYMYIVALKYLTEKDTGEVISATNMLIATFFQKSKSELIEALHKLRPGRYNYSYYKKECISVKDLLIATFMLSERPRYARKILESICMHENLKQETVDCLNRIISSGGNLEEQDAEGRNAEVENEDAREEGMISFSEFTKLWDAAREKYYGIIGEIGKEVRSATSEYRMVESIQKHKIRIGKLMESEVLWSRDEKYLGDFKGIIDFIDRTFNKYSPEEKIEGFRQVETKITKLKSDIGNAPTELSFDYISPCLDDFRNSILNQLDELYLSSIPECSISLSNDKVYVKDKRVDIAITVCNAPDKQNADAVEIELTGSRGVDFSHCEMLFTGIKSGESQEYLAVFSLADHVIEEGQFDVTVKVKYQYRVKGGSIGHAEIREVLPVNITSKEKFVPIENKYNYIIRGSSVSTDTPELFRGRNELIDRICKSMCVNGVMQKNRGLILWGQRRVGKNSVKDYLKERIREAYPDTYLIIEVGSIGKCRNVRDILVSIVNHTEFALLEDYPDIYDKLVENHVSFDTAKISEGENYMPEFSRFMHLLNIGLKKIGGAEKKIPLYFIDEFSYLYEWIEKGEIQGDVFMRFWKSFIQDYDICSIIIAQDNIPVWKSKYENEFACMNHDNEITYLDFEGAGELICEPCKPKGRELFAEDAVKLIYDWTRGSAYLIVIFCKFVIDYLNKNYTEKATKTIVKIVFEKEFIENRGMFNTGDFEPQIQDVANVGEEAEQINSLNEKLLKEIAASTIYTPRVKTEDLKFFTECEDPELARRIFDRLKERKIIEVERNTYCSIVMPLLKWYLLREQSLLDKDVLNQLVR